MKSLYDVVGFSKQAHWEWSKRQKSILDKWLLLEPVLREWRERHPSMSLKKLHHVIQPDFIGINGFIEYGMLNGFEAISYKKAPKTTILSENPDFPNLLIDRKISGINQVWVSDTTYLKVLEKWYYLTFVMDLYSRRIIGHYASSNLFAKAHLEAFKTALRTRKMNQFNNQLIHHSDRGSQYKSQLYTDAVRKAKAHISMGRIVYDNIHIERVNQTIKGEYLIHRNIKSEKDLIFHLNNDIALYNTERPHLSLDKMNPVEFERYICNIPVSQRTFLEPFASKKNRRPKKDSDLFINPDQLKFQF